MNSSEKKSPDEAKSPQAKKLKSCAGLSDVSPDKPSRELNNIFQFHQSSEELADLDDASISPDSSENEFSDSELCQEIEESTNNLSLTEISAGLDHEPTPENQSQPFEEAESNVGGPTLDNPDLPQQNTGPSPPIPLRQPGRYLKRLTEDQYQKLEEAFTVNNMPGTIEKINLAKDIGIRYRQANNWFRNRRRKLRITGE